MRSLLGRFHRPMSRGLVNNMLTMNNLGDGSTLSLDFTTMGGVLDPRLTFSRAGGGTYVGPDGYIYGVDSATSASLAIGTGSKSVTLTATAGVDRRFQVGEKVYFSSGANNMNGLVTAYDALTQVITINATATTGSGSFTSWFVGNASPRFDYSPTNIGEPRGLLVEGQTANLCTYSNDFNDGAWVKDGASTGAFDPTVDPTYSATGPDGASTVKRIIFNKTNGAFSRIKRQTNVSNATYTMSVWMKANTANGAASIQNVGLRMGSSNGVNCVVTTTWQRFTHTFAVVDGSAEFQIMLWDNISANDETADVLVYGAQLEAGSGASSLIPTGASQVTRNPDDCTITGTNFSSWFTQPQGTIFVDCEYTSKSPAQGGIQLADNSGAVETNRLSIRRNIAIASRSGITARQYTPTATARAKSAFAFGTADYKFSQNGSTFSAVAGDNGAPPISIDRLLLYAPGPVLIDGVIRQIKFYPLSLSQTQMNTLTTL